MKTLILAATALGIGIGAAYAGDGGDLPMPPPAASQGSPAATSAPRTGEPMLRAFVARHRTTTSLFPPNPVGDGAHD